MTNLNVPCVLIDNLNFHKWWSFIIETISGCDFLSIDLEMSGLGSKDMFTSQIDERYQSIRSVVSTRSILSMGLACFKINNKKGIFKRKMKVKLKTNPEKSTFEQLSNFLEEDSDLEEDITEDEDYYTNVTVFNFLTLCSSEFTIEARSMKFLAQQGFDFNELATKGILYSPGNDRDYEESTPSLRKLMAEIVASKKTIVFHNGLLDLAFLYHHFYLELPIKLQTFLADLYEMFPNGVFDTKCIAITYLSNSYLEYLFNYSQRDNYFRKLKNHPSVNINFTELPEDMKNDVRYFDLTSKIMQVSSDVTKICYNYAEYGWCEKSDMCKNSHNIDLILDENLISKKDKKSKYLVKHFKQINESDVIQKNSIEPTPMRKTGCHHSGNDAFMTGYYFFFYLVVNCQKKISYKEFKKLKDNLTKFKNKVFLSSKIHPLLIMKSNFASTSTNHKEKILKINKSKEKLEIETQNK